LINNVRVNDNLLELVVTENLGLSLFDNSKKEIYEWTLKKGEKNSYSDSIKERKRSWESEDERLICKYHCGFKCIGDCKEQAYRYI